MSSAITPTLPTAMLRPVLEAAVQVARAGETSDPVQPAPPALRRYLRFAKLPVPALDIARRVVEEDEQFRARVAAQLDESQVGETGWLWLTRPDGWQERLDEIRKREQERDHAEREERTERDALRRLSAAEDRARRAEAAVASRAQEVATAREELAAERARRQASERELARIQEMIGELRSQRNAAVRQLKEVEGELAQRTADLRHARHEIRMHQAELAQTPVAPVAPVAPVGPAAEPSEAAAPAVNEHLTRFVADVAASAERLAAALGNATAAAGDAPVAPPAEPSGPAAPVARRPVRLPGGVRDDTSDAADHLLRAGMLLLVDGYNVSQAAWWGQPIAVQRNRLVDALTELHARTGVDAEVVFDGTEGGGVVGTTRSAIRVRFTAGGVEADDLILERVRQLPPGQPVVVASSDNRVRDGARRLGANVLSSKQLLTALRR